jgi:hypothetical protein
MTTARTDVYNFGGNDSNKHTNHNVTRREEHVERTSKILQFKAHASDKF